MSTDQKKHAVEGGGAGAGDAEGAGEPAGGAEGVGQAEHPGADDGDDDVPDRLGGVAPLRPSSSGTFGSAAINPRQTLRTT